MEGGCLQARSPLYSLPILLILVGCATSSGVPAASIPLHQGSMLSHADGAAVAIAPGVAVTNGYNRNLVGPKAVIGEVKDYDPLFSRSA